MDLMDKQISIMEKIVAEEGSCTWSNKSICSICPLGKLDIYESGRYMSCVEALKIDGLSEEEADAIYKAAAEKKLANLLIEKTIRESN